MSEENLDSTIVSKKTRIEYLGYIIYYCDDTATNPVYLW